MSEEKRLFDIFTTKKNQWECYVAVQELLKHCERYVKGQQNAEFNNVLSTVEISLNESLGKENSETFILSTLDYIDRLKSDISSVYPEFI